MNLGRHVYLHWRVIAISYGDVVCLIHARPLETKILESFYSVNASPWHQCPSGLDKPGAMLSLSNPQSRATEL